VRQGGPPGPTLAYLALGSNLGDRAANLQSALQLLDEPRLRLRRQSGIRETAPEGHRFQPAYLNMAAAFETDLFPRQLLHVCMAAEMQLGRRRIGCKTPRTIDIDIIFFGDWIVNTPELTIPHPRWSTRPFVVGPLAEIKTL
jgi:2-amino-4-hydroxy-6-hydroxymethyldihydropteridine diphosphokinase